MYSKDSFTKLKKHLKKEPIHYDREVSITDRQCWGRFYSVYRPVMIELLRHTLKPDEICRAEVILDTEYKFVSQKKADENAKYQGFRCSHLDLGLHATAETGALFVRKQDDEMLSSDCYEMDYFGDFISGYQISRNNKMAHDDSCEVILGIMDKISSDEWQRVMQARREDRSRKDSIMSQL